MHRPAIIPEAVETRSRRRHGLAPRTLYFRISFSSWIFLDIGSARFHYSVIRRFATATRLPTISGRYLLNDEVQASICRGANAGACAHACCE